MPFRFRHLALKFRYKQICLTKKSFENVVNLKHLAMQLVEYLLSFSYGLLGYRLLFKTVILKSYPYFMGLKRRMTYLGKIMDRWCLRSVC